MLVFAGPGAGKTLGALLAFKAMQQEGRLQRFVVFCHRTSILSQWQGAAQRLKEVANPRRLDEAVREELAIAMQRRRARAWALQR